MSSPPLSSASIETTRRAFIAGAARACVASAAIAAFGGAPTAAVASVRPGRGARRTAPHPEPRPGIDASRMPTPAQVQAHARAVPAFEEARTIPEILDGIRCQCGCADGPGMRSLLTCFEGEDAMALYCEICEGQARLAYRLHGKGRSLDQIRAAIDARYGGG